MDLTYGALFSVKAQGLTLKYIRREMGKKKEEKMEYKPRKRKVL